MPTPFILQPYFHTIHKQTAPNNDWNKIIQLQQLTCAMRPQSPRGQDAPALCRKAEYWHRRYHDLELRFYEVKAELSSVLEREQRERCAFRMDEGRRSAIVAAVAPLRDQLCTTQLLLAEREDTVQGLLQQLKCKEDELKRLNDELLRQTEERKVAELSCAEARSSLEAAVVKCRSKEDDCKLLLGQLEKAKDDLNLADLELNKLRTSQPELHCEAWELRGHLEAVLDKEARNSRMVNLLQAERDMWFSRSEHYERNYDSLRRNLCDLASHPEIVEISITSPTGRPSVVPVPPRRLFYPRRFGRRTAGDATLDTRAE